MSKPKPSKYVLMIGAYERHELTLTPIDAARAATQIARGTLDRTKSIHEQPDNAKPGRKVKLYDESGELLMHCGPTLLTVSPRAKRVNRTMAACDISPGFKKQLRKRRRAKKR